MHVGSCRTLLPEGCLCRSWALAVTAFASRWHKAAHPCIGGVQFTPDERLQDHVVQEWGNSFGSKPTYFRRYEVKTRGAIGALLQAKVFNFNQRREVSQVDLPVVEHQPNRCCCVQRTVDD